MFKIPREGALRLLAELLQAGDGKEDWLLCLIGSPVEQAEDDDAAKFLAVEADWEGYQRKTVTRAIAAGAWGQPVSVDPIYADDYPGKSKVATSSYGETFNTKVAPGSTVYGWFLIGAESGILVSSDLLGCPFVACDGGGAEYTPYFEFG